MALAAAPEDPASVTAFGRQASQSIAPFLTKHIPEMYKPVAVYDQMRKTQQGYTPPETPKGNSNTKYCYRHRPDLKCRRQANEPSMEQLQNV